MFSNEERMIYAKRQLVEVICQLRFPEILSIDASEPAAFQDRIRREYPQYEKKIEQLPPQMVNGKPVPQGTVNNYQFISEDGQWKVSLTKSFVALSTARVIFSPTASPILAIINLPSQTPITVSIPLIRPLPVTTASVSPVLSCRALTFSSYPGNPSGFPAVIP